MKCSHADVVNDYSTEILGDVGRTFESKKQYLAPKGHVVEFEAKHISAAFCDLDL